MGQIDDILKGDVDCYVRTKGTGERFDRQRHIGLIIMGSDLSLTEHICRPEREWAATAIESGIPLLGICHGAQLIAYIRSKDKKNCIKKLTKNDRGLSQLRIKGSGLPDAQRDEIVLPAFSALLCQYHDWRYTLPPDSINLANSEDMTHSDAFRLRGKQVYGLQFHPELTASVMIGDKWAPSTTSREDCEKTEVTGRRILEGWIRQATESNG
jgi:GMP synthase-like glutamine amidotransferase